MTVMNQTISLSSMGEEQTLAPDTDSEYASGPDGLTAGRLGIWILIASEIVIFAGILGSFILFRRVHPEWAEESSHLNLIAGSFNTLILLGSNFFMMKASAAAEKNRQDRVSLFLLPTLILGTTFLVIKGFEYTMEFRHGEFPSTNNFWSFYFLMTGIHALHILGGLLAISLLWNRARKGTLGPTQGRVALTGLYWSFVELVWIFLFPMLYLMK
jgi:heme/copper-type cytochrome/quinol oxidase subunit 3